MSPAWGRDVDFDTALPMALEGRTGACHPFSMAISGDTDRLPTRPASPRRSRFAAPTRAGNALPLDPAISGLAPVVTAVSARRRSRWRTLRGWLIGLVLLAVVAPPVLGVALVGAIYWQARTDETRPVDAIVVLGTAQFNGRPGPVLRARLDRALAVYEAGMAPLIVVTGGKQQGDQFTEAQAGRDYLVEQGVPTEAILLENRGQDSWQSMQSVAALLEYRQLSRVLLVSDGFHLFRLKKMAHDLGLTAYGTAATSSPIRRSGPTEFSYVLRETGGVVAHLWETR